MSTDDIQIQDVTISYDLDSKGQYQVTGQSKSNQSMINAHSTVQQHARRRNSECGTSSIRWGDWRVQKTDRDRLSAELSLDYIAQKSHARHDPKLQIKFLPMTSLRTMSWFSFSFSEAQSNQAHKLALAAQTCHKQA
jgi:hypothetical protein